MEDSGLPDLTLPAPKRTDATRRLRLMARRFRGRDDAFADALTAMADWHCEGRRYAFTYGVGDLSRDKFVVLLDRKGKFRVECDSLTFVADPERKTTPWEVIHEALRLWAVEEKRQWLKERRDGNPDA